MLKLDGDLVEGVVDFAFLEDSAEFAGWTVVDFKTDREFATTSNRLHSPGDRLFCRDTCRDGAAFAGDPADYLTR